MSSIVIYLQCNFHLIKQLVLILMTRTFDTEPLLPSECPYFTANIYYNNNTYYNGIAQYLSQVNLMNKLGTDVFTNFQQANHQMGRQDEQVHVLLLGKCGVGKSSLVNNLCGSNVQTGVCPKSLTVILDQISSSCIQQLQLCDAPGVSSEDQNSSLIIRRALRHLPWNLIIIQTKLDARFQYNTLPELKRLARLFKQDANRIIFMVSCIDKQKQGQERDILLENFRRSLEKYSFTQKLILFSNESSDFELISRIIYDQGCKTNKKIISFDDDKLSIQLGIQECEDQFKEQKNQTRDELINQINKLMPGKNRKGVKRQYHSVQKNNRNIETVKTEFDLKVDQRKQIQLIYSGFKVDQRKQIQMIYPDLKTNQNRIRVRDTSVKRAKEFIQKQFQQKNKKNDEKLAEERERKEKERKQKEQKQQVERKRNEQMKNQVWLKNKEEFERKQQQKLRMEAKRQQIIINQELNAKLKQLNSRKQNEKTTQQYIAFQQQRRIKYVRL